MSSAIFQLSLELYDVVLCTIGDSIHMRDNNEKVNYNHEFMIDKIQNMTKQIENKLNELESEVKNFNP